MGRTGRRLNNNLIKRQMNIKLEGARALDGEWTRGKGRSQSQIRNLGVARGQGRVRGMHERPQVWHAKRLQAREIRLTAAAKGREFRFQLQNLAFF